MVPFHKVYPSLTPVDVDSCARIHLSTTVNGQKRDHMKLRLESAIVQIQHQPYVREVTNNVIIRSNE